MHIRPIEMQDVEEGIDLIQRMLLEGKGYSDVPFHKPAMRGWLHAAVERPDEFFCAVAIGEKGIVGGMLGVKVPFAFSFTLRASELGLYVAPECRGSSLALKLVRRFEQWARDQDCKRAQVGVTVGINDEHAIRFYKKLGYKVEGPLMYKDL